MEKKLVEKNIKELLEKLKNEIGEDEKVVCEWRSSYANISVIKENKEMNYTYFNANVYDNGVYSLGHTFYNYQEIFDNYFTNTGNLIDYNEFKELLDLDKESPFADKDFSEMDYYFGLEREFELRLEREAIELTVHNGPLTYHLHQDPEGNEWNLKTLKENQLSSDIRGDYGECFYELRHNVKYADLFIELTRQDKMVNVNNTNENGIKEGLWVIPKEDEWIKEEICFFENDILNGKYAEIFKNNEISEIGTYKENIKNGEAFSYDTNTLNLTEEKIYENGILNGKYKSFLHTGELLSEGSLINGEFNGAHQMYDSDKEGKIFLWQMKEFKNGLEEGPAVNYFPNGKFKTEFNMKAGNLQGKCIEYYENGNIKEISNYENDKLNGSYKAYDIDGILEKECNYKDGKLDGNCKEYYFGRLFSDRNYENNMLNGKAKEYLLNIDGTSTCSEGYYVNDEKQGLWTEYDKEGILHSTQNYTDNREDGTYKQYTKEGILEYTEEWEYGEQLNAIDYYSNGKIQVVEQWADGTRNGIAESFYETGELKEKYNHKDGELDGPCTTYDKKGNIIEKVMYEKNKVVKNLLEKKQTTKNSPWEKKLKKDKINELER